MTEREAFRLAMRVLSMALVVYGIADLSGGVALFLSLLLTKNPNPCGYSPLDYWFAGLFFFVAGLLLVRAKWPLRFVYGPDSN
jgi:hypothetical protein